MTHHHARSVLPFAITGQRLRPVFHMGSVIGATIPLWESQDEFGDTNMLVDRWEMGVSLAKALGPNTCALLAGHGAVVTGNGLKDAVFTSIYLKETAEALLASLPLGRAALPHGRRDREDRDHVARAAAVGARMGLLSWNGAGYRGL